jgi:hypothetical protein
VAPLGDDPYEQRLVVLERRGHVLERRELAPVRFVPMLPGIVDE